MLWVVSSRGFKVLCAMLSLFTYQSDWQVVLNSELNLGTYLQQPSRWSSFQNNTLRTIKKSLLFQDDGLMINSQSEVSFPNSVVRKAGCRDVSCVFFTSFYSFMAGIFCTYQLQSAVCDHSSTLVVYRSNHKLQIHPVYC